VKVVTLLTDFGLKDPYVGMMKGVILSIAPDTAIVDITHEVDPQDIREGAFILKEHYPYFAQGTIHVAVIDPTVGSQRRPVIVSRDGHLFLGPDNGLFTLVAGTGSAVHLIENKAYMLEPVSSTFHGRDVFAPAAGYLSSGIEPRAFGRPIADPVLLEDLLPVTLNHILYGQVVRFDRFGNAITNIHVDQLRAFVAGRPYTINIGKMTFHEVGRSYFEQDATCLVGSSGYLEFGYFKSSFRDELGAWKGDEVTVRTP
jgi:S-adenosyl-L-methionine hydrolase (adenosine-forming)